MTNVVSCCTLPPPCHSSGTVQQVGWIKTESVKPLTGRPGTPLQYFTNQVAAINGTLDISSSSKKVTALLKLRLARKARRRTLVQPSVETSSLRQSRLRTILKHWITTSFGCFVYSTSCHSMSDQQGAAAGDVPQNTQDLTVFVSAPHSPCTKWPRVIQT